MKHCRSSGVAGAPVIFLSGMMLFAIISDAIISDCKNCGFVSSSGFDFDTTSYGARFSVETNCTLLKSDTLCHRLEKGSGT